jgi:hypothetical protein
VGVGIHSKRHILTSITPFSFCGFQIVKGRPTIFRTVVEHYLNTCK